jgi:predicted metal-dependent peptidase
MDKPGQRDKALNKEGNTMAQTKAMKRVKEAISQLLATNPFFAILLLKLDIVESTSVQTMCVSPTALYFNPTFVLGLSMAELKAVLAHEVLHLALGHHWRQGSRKHGLWNHATDYAINARLIKDGFFLPEGALLDDRFSDTSAESTYRTLEGEQPKPQEGQGSGNGQGDSGDKSEDKGQGDDSQSTMDNSAGQGSGQDDSTSPQDSSNSPSNGKPEDNGQEDSQGSGQGNGQEEGYTPNIMGEFESAGPEDSAESREAQRQWQENVNEAIRVATKAGKLPADMARELQEANKPKEDWWNLLRRFVSDKTEYLLTWNRPSRRFEDMMLPGKEANALGPLIAIVDTSCSITQPVLNIFGAHLKSFLADIPFTNLTVIYCDSKVQRVETYYPGDSINLKVYGGGGTSFKPPFAHIEKENLNPVCAIYLTDMEGDGWPVEPNYPVLWAAYNARGIVAPWGETIVID